MRKALYADFYGFSEEPFNVTPDPKFLFLDESYREALAHLEYGVLYGKGFILLSGEVGTGKTTLLNAMFDRLPTEFTTAFIFSSTMSFVELLKMIHEDFGTGISGDSEATLLIGLNRFLIREYEEGKNSVLVLDEAQNLDRGLLEKIRLLSNLEARKTKLLQIVLSGQPELIDKLEDPALRQLDQRIAIRYTLTPLSRIETNNYIDHRLTVAESKGRVSFTDDAIDLIFEYSRGIPRLVNIVCGNALLLGFGAGKRKIDRGVVAEVISDLRRKVQRVLMPHQAAAAIHGGSADAAAPAPVAPIAPLPASMRPEPPRTSAAAPQFADLAPGAASVEPSPAAEQTPAPSAAPSPAPITPAPDAYVESGPASGNGERPWTTEEAAFYLRISVSGVRRLFKRGDIAARRVGRGWRVHRAELDRFVRGERSRPDGA